MEMVGELREAGYGLFRMILSLDVSGEDDIASSRHMGTSSITRCLVLLFGRFLVFGWDLEAAVALLVVLCDVDGLAGFFVKEGGCTDEVSIFFLPPAMPAVDLYANFELQNVRKHAD